MADTLKLTNYGSTITYDLLNDALHAYYSGWTVQPAGPNRWTETFMLVAKDSDSNIIEAANEIGVLIDMCRLWNTSDKIFDSVWLEEHGTAESAKRALVYNMEFVPIPRGILNPLLGKGGVFYQLAITRGNWEATVDVDYATQSGISAYAGSFSVAAVSIGGSLPARISELKYTGTAACSGPLDRVWAGIKPTRTGTSGFDPRWEAEDAYYTQTCTPATKTGAYPSGSTNTQVVALGTNPSYAARIWMKVENVVASDYEDMAGRYIALLRYNLTASDSVAYVGLMQGVGEFAYTAPIQWIEYTSGNWRYLPMGVVDIPGQKWRALGYGANYLRNFALVLYAGLSAGTGTELWVDSVLLVPFEHSFFTAGNSLSNTGTATTSKLLTHENMEYEALSFDTSGQVNKVLQQQPNNWWLPLEGGKFVFVGEQSTLTDIDDTVTVNVSWYTRWGAHRGV